eukprot:m.26870 g.26870  ORF g.26870 m.26870 type:complete len:283 (+) comp15577_c0_seq2:282-1130(+)
MAYDSDADMSDEDWLSDDCYTGEHAHITSITIPTSMTHIGAREFQHFNAVKAVDIPDSVTSIGNRAFSDCFSLTSVSIPNSVTSIGKAAFAGCEALTAITIPNSISSIPYCSFAVCTSLASIQLPSSVTHIGNNAFSNCNLLSAIDIPDSVTSIHPTAFRVCTSLRLAVASLTAVRSHQNLNYCSGEYFGGCPKLIGKGLTLSTPASRLHVLQLHFWSPSTQVELVKARSMIPMTVMLVADRLRGMRSVRVPALPDEIWIWIMQCLRPHELATWNRYPRIYC